MKIVAVSDLHLDEQCRLTLLRAAQSADLVICVGDFAQRREGLADYMSAFAPLGDKAVFVAGNNETPEELRATTDIPVLHGTSLQIGRLTIAGIGGSIPPVTPPGWASFNLDEDKAHETLAQIEAADILISHSPPKDACDWHHEMGHMGSVAVRGAIERLQPKWALCGHVHDSWGSRSRIGNTMVANLGPVPVTIEITP